MLNSVRQPLTTGWVSTKLHGRIGREMTIAGCTYASPVHQVSTHGVW